MRLRASGERIVDCQSRCGSSPTSSSNSSKLTLSTLRFNSNAWAEADSIPFESARTIERWGSMRPTALWWWIGSHADYDRLVV